ncbi:MAG: ABC transporter substrate-binding protein [Eubacteriales bacterium]|nr:ABC transporter substrate-binding protein [Eubacteriales bacterium]
MKRVFSVLLASAMIFVLAACGSSSSSAPASTTAAASGETAAAAAATEYKDTLVFCNGQDLTTLDASIGQQERAVYLTNHMFDPLVTFGENEQIVPCLAESFEWSDDSITLTVVLKKGVKFHDGSDMTAEDVKFTMDLLQQRGMTFGGNYDNTEIVDDYTVKIHLNAPNPAFLNTIAMPQCCILPSDAYDEATFGQNPIGTGPYKLKEYKEGDYYTIERFDDYFGEPAKTQYITLRIVPEPSQRAILLETGEVDVAYNLSFNDIDRLSNDPNMKVLRSPSMKVINIDFNCQSTGPIGNPKVRQAVECAMDKDIIVNSLLSGYGEVSKSLISPLAADYRETFVNEYNPEKAKQLLAEAGYADGCEMTLFTNSDQINGEMATVIQNQLAAVGIKLNIVVQDDNTTFAMVENGEDFDMILDFFQCASKHADYVFVNAYTSDSFNNYSRYFDDEFDQTYYKYCATAEGEEREALLNKLYEMLGTNTPAIGIYTENKIVVTSAKVDGVKLSTSGAHEFQYATVAK